MSAQACGGVRPEHLTLATAAELIHTATLVHDDVLDEATIRRHLDTVNARWNNEVSVLLGDYLFARALCLTSSLDDNFACRTITETTRRMCEGELRQIENRGNYGLSEAEYVEIIAGKTATLMACCCRLGAHYAGAAAGDLRHAWPATATELGVAFQIADDVLDLLGEEATVGKSLGTDLLKQKATLPLIRLFETADPRAGRANSLAIGAVGEPSPRRPAALVREVRHDRLCPPPGRIVRAGRPVPRWTSCPTRRPADRWPGLPSSSSIDGNSGERYWRAGGVSPLFP